MSSRASTRKLRVYLHADRRRGDVANVQMHAQALVACRKQVLDGGKRRRLDQIDHHRGGEHVNPAAPHLGCGVLLADQQFGRALEAGVQS